MHIYKYIPNTHTPYANIYKYTPRMHMNIQMHTYTHSHIMNFFCLMWCNYWLVTWQALEPLRRQASGQRQVRELIKEGRPTQNVRAPSHRLGVWRSEKEEARGTAAFTTLLPDCGLHDSCPHSCHHDFPIMTGCDVEWTLPPLGCTC